MKVFGSMILAGLLCGNALAAQPSIVVAYQTPKGKDETQVRQLIEQSEVNDTLVALSKSYFVFDQTLTVKYGGEDGPMYDPEVHTVFIPYGFVLEAIRYFRDNDDQQTSGNQPTLSAMDTLLHTLLHEAGHAYVADQNIPVLGKEEDAVDNFATLMMIRYVDGGDDAAISAANMFAYESNDRTDFYDFGEYIDEHSFDLQRYFSTLCLVYGSDPKQYAKLLDEVENDYLAERKEFCIENYQQLDQNWHVYLTDQP
ncbi:DUF4344 domain-containing metallopeptidase [Photobacterium sp. MCCC 1A19761]|uniref:DUF4344 domain-containing metallopeptidase n=1 Tax=Photobacterium sp. MCCC 1A19761 TaxID=3115000 RepID=UPI00307DD1ED